MSCLEDNERKHRGLPAPHTTAKSSKVLPNPPALCSFLIVCSDYDRQPSLVTTKFFGLANQIRMPSLVRMSVVTVGASFLKQRIIPNALEAE